MAVKLRLRRMGRKKKPFYRIVAADARSPRDGKFIEEFGYYNPIDDPITLEVKEDRALYWLGVGAQPSDTVRSLFRKKGITLRFDLLKRGVPEEKIEEELQKWDALRAAREQRLAEAKAQKQASKTKEETTAEAPVEEEAKKAKTAPKAAAEPQEAAPEAVAAEAPVEEVAEKTEAAPETEAVPEAPAEEVAEKAPVEEVAEKTEAAPETDAVPEAEADPEAPAEDASEETKEEK